ncbi:unnamed protein product [Paramecium sonneborni]|uniref:Uncharacterized protein n=1 Tax=Paramecium sonneborni TaxID=65129 RepID=A0A8S1N944_9CILI|nr:unnamed protein product [Paramecium sonneborni]
MQIDQQQQSAKTQNKEVKNLKKKEEAQLIVFPQKFLNPFLTYRMNGDFHLYAAACYIQNHSLPKIGMSCQNPYKKITNIVLDQCTETITLHYTQLDYLSIPSEYVIKRLESYGDFQMNQLGEYIKKYNEQLNSVLNQENSKMIVRNQYRSKGSYKYKYVKELDQFFISSLTYDIKLIEDLGFSVQQFIEACFKTGIPEISLKPDNTNDQYYKNVVEFAKPLVFPDENQDFYLYSYRYPYGLKTDVSFLIRKENQNSQQENDDLINFNFYFNYTPKIQTNNTILQSKKLRSSNNISFYYQIQENQFQRCGYKKIKLS